MNKLALSAALAALALSPVLSQAAHADDTTAPTSNNWQDNFFVAGQLGQTQYRTDLLSHDNGVFQNVRFGWRWNGLVGPEIGYVYLGRPKDVANDAQLSVKPRAATVGINAKYNFYQNWFVTGHAGYMRSQTYVTGIYGDSSTRAKTSNNGLYAGLGVGYDVTNNFSVGLNYDNYRVQVGNNTSVAHDRTNVAAYSASAEYRF